MNIRQYLAERKRSLSEINTTAGMSALWEIDALLQRYPEVKPKPAPDAPGWWWRSELWCPIYIGMEHGKYGWYKQCDFVPVTTGMYQWLGPIEKPEFGK